jgi:archaellum component FlaC
MQDTSENKEISPETTANKVKQLLHEGDSLNALIKGVTTDIEIFKKKSDKESASNIVRLTVQLNTLLNRKKHAAETLTTLLIKHKEGARAITENQKAA